MQMYRRADALGGRPRKHLNNRYRPVPFFPNPSGPMKRAFKSFTIVSLLLTALLAGCASGGAKPPRAIKGVLDLSNWDVESHPLRLTGEWEFYRGKLFGRSVKPGAHDEIAYVDVPHKWEYRLPFDSVATYRLHVKLGRSGQALGFIMRQAITAYRVYVDTQLVIQEGILSADRKSFQAVFKPSAAFFHVDGREFDIAVQIQSYYNLKSSTLAKSGFWPSLLMCSTSACFRTRLIDFGTSLFIVGGLFIICILQLVYFFLMRRQLAHLFLSLACASAGAMMMSGPSETIISTLVPAFSPAIYLSIWGITQFSIPMFLFLTIASTFPKETNWKTLWAIVPYYVVLCIIAAVWIDAYFVTDFFDYCYKIHSMFCLIYANIVLVLAIWRKRSGAIFMLIGTFFFCIGTASALSNQDDVNVSLLIVFVFLVFFGQSILLSKIFAKAQNDAMLNQSKLAQAEKLVTLGTIVAEVAHEINNPSHALLLDVQSNEKTWSSVQPFLRERAKEKGDFKIGVFPQDKFQSEMAELSSRMKRNCERIKGVVEDLRLYARKDAQLTEDVNVNKVVESAISVIEDIASKCTKNLHLHLDQSIPLIKGNYRHLEQVIINIVKNACQSLQDINGNVFVSSRYTEKDIIVEVRDEGRGMDEQTRNNIFMPFYTTKSKDGTGLGLFICMNIVKSHGGRIEVESKVGHGTVVMVILPAATD
jgi:signal transduction histidine kinase